MSDNRLRQLQRAVAARLTIETHISWVLLTEDAAYKVKKPVKNDFLDYSTLALRQHFCEQELRLDRRYAPDLYLGVVRFVESRTDANRLELDETQSSSQPVREYGIKMLRFPPDDLLSERLARGQVPESDIRQFATALADFHEQAAVALPPIETQPSFGDAETIYHDAVDNLQALRSVFDDRTRQALSEWTDAAYTRLRACFDRRQQSGWIRECHGDLHAGNIVYWRGKLIPFDGVEFNEHFRWIDVLSDTGFLAMDLYALGHTELASAFINQYLEQTGDYRELGLLRWYMVYRALVRAKVSEMVRQQQAADSPAAAEAVRERDEHVALAVKLIAPGQPRLWITFGLSGSGKSTAARALAMRCGAIQIRSDVERKRLLGYKQAFRPDPEQTAAMYSTSMHGQTYEQLRQLSKAVLEAGFSVVVDAAFLKREQRAAFSKLAGELQVPFHILACEAPVDILKARLDERMQAGDDASDAGVEVLEQQLASHDALDAEERAHVDERHLNA